MSGRKTAAYPEDLPLRILQPVRCCCQVSGDYHDPAPLCPVHGVKMNRRTIPNPEPPKHYRPVTYGGVPNFHA